MRGNLVAGSTHRGRGEQIPDAVGTERLIQITANPTLHRPIRLKNLVGRQLTSGRTFMSAEAHILRQKLKSATG